MTNDYVHQRSQCLATVLTFSRVDTSMKEKPSWLKQRDFTESLTSAVGRRTKCYGLKKANRE